MQYLIAGAILVAVGVVSLGYGAGMMTRSWQSNQAAEPVAVVSGISDGILPGRQYRMRNGSVVGPLRVSSRGGFEAWVVEGYHVSGAEWTKDGECIGGSITFSNDLSQFDLDNSHLSPRRVTPVHSTEG